MCGGKSEDPAVGETREVSSWRKLSVPFHEILMNHVVIFGSRCVSIRAILCEDAELLTLSLRVKPLRALNDPLSDGLCGHVRLMRPRLFM